MLGLALVPTIVGVLATASLLGHHDSSVLAAQSRGASTSASSLLARQQAVEARFLRAAAEPTMARIADGIAGPGDRQLATRTLERLRGSDGIVVEGACIVRGEAQPATSLVPRLGPGPEPSCADGTLWRAALSAPPGTLRRAALHDPGSGYRLLLAAPLRTGREAVLSARIDIDALFRRTPLAGSESATTMLVDLGTSRVVAAMPPAEAPEGAARLTSSQAAAYMRGILSAHRGTMEALSSVGLLATLVPLWNVSSGPRVGLVQLWPTESEGIPPTLAFALVAVIVGAVMAVVALVRYFLEPIEELADSKARLQVLYREARQDALNDALTGLGNHRAFQEELDRQISVSRSRATSFALLLLDVDDLKVVNDSRGHAAGDQLLTSMAGMMRELTRPADRLYRIGGDEFAVIMPDAEIPSALVAAERMLHFSRRPRSGWPPSPFSCGISGVPAFARDRGTVYRQADAALYWAKRHGRGAVEVFDPVRDQIPGDASDLNRQAVLEVVTGRLLAPVFQPIVDLRDGRVIGFEGLIRPDPNGPLPDASRLFAAAAAAGRTVELDLACLEAVIDAARAIDPARLLTLNLSPRTLEVRDFDVAWLLDGLVRNGISPARVILELTERDPIDDLRRLQQTFTHLQSYGLRLAADDVGAGNSGLRLLSQVQFDIVKIDLSLVHEGVHRLGSRAVLQSLRDLALGQAAHIVAEGVETPEQLKVIRELEIGAGQGFLLGRPDRSVEATFVDVSRLAAAARPVVDGTAQPLPAETEGPAGRQRGRAMASKAPSLVLPTPGERRGFEIRPDPA